MGRYWHVVFPFVGLLMFLIQLETASALQVFGVSGGESVVNGSTPLVVLDCHYSIHADEVAGLVVSWYYGSNLRPVYQWIYGTQPQALGLLRGRLDLNYQPSPDPLKAHSALAFVTPTTELAGEYTCRVSTYQAEQSATGSFIVYTPASEFDFKMSTPSFGKVAVECEARNVFPEPNFVLFKTDVKTKRRSLMASSLQKVYDPERNVFSLSLQSSIIGHQLIRETEFECLLSVPGTDYRLKETLLYYPSAISSSAKPVAGRSVRISSGSASCSCKKSAHQSSLVLIAASLFALFFSCNGRFR